MTTEEILEAVSNVSNTLTIRDIQKLCTAYDWRMINSRKGFKVYIKNSVWCFHLERRQQLKHGIIRNLRKVLIKEQII
jgi:hypothetical protein